MHINKTIDAARCLSYRQISSFAHLRQLCSSWQRQPPFLSLSLARALSRPLEPPVASERNLMAISWAAPGSRHARRAHWAHCASGRQLIIGLAAPARRQQAATATRASQTQWTHNVRAHSLLPPLSKGACLADRTRRGGAFGALRAERCVARRLRNRRAERAAREAIDDFDNRISSSIGHADGSSGLARLVGRRRGRGRKRKLRPRLDTFFCAPLENTCATNCMCGRVRTVGAKQKTSDPNGRRGPI